MISIIMPVFNTGPILRTTIESILNQTYSDWELLLVDDGSTDGSAAICDEYSEQDDRIRAFHKENGGICNARNYGMNQVKGDYIAFCDHDDQYSPTLLEKCDEIIGQRKADVICYRSRYILDDGTSTESYSLSSEPVFETINDNYFFIDDKGYFSNIWTKLYRTDIIKKNNLKFDETYKYGGEDIAFNHAVIRCRPSYCFMPDVLYDHYVRKSLSTSQKYHPENVVLPIRQMKDYNDTIEMNHFKPANNAILYLRKFIWLFHVYMESISREGKDSEFFCNRCKEFEKLNVLISTATFRDYAKIRFGNYKDKLISFLVYSKMYYSLYMLFYINNLRKK